MASNRRAMKHLENVQGSMSIPSTKDSIDLVHVELLIHLGERRTPVGVLSGSPFPLAWGASLHSLHLFVEVIKESMDPERAWANSAPHPRKLTCGMDPQLTAKQSDALFLSHGKSARS